MYLVNITSCALFPRHTPNTQKTLKNSGFLQTVYHHTGEKDIANKLKHQKQIWLGGDGARL